MPYKKLNIFPMTNKTSSQIFYTIEEAKNILNEDKDKKFEKEHDNNVFLYEKRPLLWIAKSLKKNDVLLKFPNNELDEKGIDGILKIDKKEQFIQFTSTLNHQDSLRKEYLKKHGIAPAFQDIKCSGNKNNRDIPKQKLGYKSSKQYAEEITTRVIEAINKKNKKQYVGMWLGMFVDGKTLDYSEITQLLGEVIKLKKANFVFKAIFFYGYCFFGDLDDKWERYIVKYDINNE